MPDLIDPTKFTRPGLKKLIRYYKRLIAKAHRTGYSGAAALFQEKVDILQSELDSRRE